MFVSLPNVPNVVLNLPEGAKLNHLWELRKPWELDPRQYNFEGGLQPPFSTDCFFSPKAQQQMETYTRSEPTKSFPQGGKIQTGDTGNRQDIPPTRGVGHLNRLQGRLLPYTNTGTVQ